MFRRSLLVAALLPVLLSGCGASRAPIVAPEPAPPGVETVVSPRSPPTRTVEPSTAAPVAVDSATATTSPPTPRSTPTERLTSTARPATTTPAPSAAPAGPTEEASATPSASSTVALSPVDATQVANATGTAVAAATPEQATPVPAGQPAPLPTATDGRYPKPAEPGFVITIAADSAEAPFEHVTAITWGPDGAMYVARMEGPIVRVTPDGTRTTFADGFAVPLGLAFRPGTGQLFVSHRGGVTILQDTNGDGIADGRQPFLTGMPCCYADLHQTNGIEFGPDGWLYVAQGSTSDHGEAEGEPWHAGILRVHPDRGQESLEYVATGLRNPFDLTITPEGQIFATDNGADYGPPEELNHILPGNDYGWPYCITESPGQVAVHPTWNDPERCEGTRPAVTTFVPHASANGLTDYDGQAFPSSYRGNLFVALWSHIPGAYRIVRVQLTPQGDTYQAHPSDFATDFELPLAVAVGPDGALYVGDWGPGRIYRIAYSSQ